MSAFAHLAVCLAACAAASAASVGMRDAGTALAGLPDAAYGA